MKLSLTTRIFFLFVLAMISLLAASLYSTVIIDRQRNSLALLNDGYLPLIKTIAQIETVAGNQEKDLNRIFEVDDTRVRTVLTRLVVHYFPLVLRRNIESAEAKVALLLKRSSDNDHLSLLDAVAKDLASIKTLQAQYEDVSKVLVDQENIDPEAFKARQEQITSIERDLKRSITLISLRLEQQVSRVSMTIERRGNQSLMVMGVMIAAALIIALVVLFLVAWSLSPLRRLKEEATRISQGDYSHRIKVKRNDEIGELAAEFDAMRHSLHVRDLELKQHREDLLRSERLAAVGKMAYHVTHEIRNPLSSISLNAEMLLEDLGHGDMAPDVRSSMEAIIRETERLSAITEEYLMFARLPKGERQKVELPRVIGHVATLMEPSAMVKNIKLSTEIRAEASVLADENQLIQALINLVKNAIEAMGEEGGEIALILDRDGQKAEISVQDNGKGLPPDQSPEKLFDPFVSTKIGGTGLGLAVCQSIARDFGGSITCRNRLTGGAEFTLTLPVE